MNILNNIHTYVNESYHFAIDAVQRSNLSLKIATAALLLKGVSCLTSSPTSVHLVGGSIANAVAGSALLYHGIKRYHVSGKDKDKKNLSKITPALQVFIGVGLLSWSGYDLWRYFNLSSISPEIPTATAIPTAIPTAISTGQSRDLDLDQERIIAIGDVHGDFPGLKENLEQSKLVDDEGNWIGGRQTFVQLGDIVDRGPYSEKSWKYLQKLQEQAQQAGGKVVRIIGNHELMWLEGDFRYIAKEDTIPVQMRVIDAIKNDILNCTNIVNCAAQAGYVSKNGKIVFVHAGIIKKLDNILRMEVVEATGVTKQGVSNHAIIERMNEILRKAVKTNTYSHPIFEAGASRGGGGVDGVFWADKSVLDSDAVSSMLQVVGHNIPRPGEAPIRFDPNRRVVYADAGMLSRYGGRRCFVEIDKGSLFSQCKEGVNWVKKLL